MSTSALLARRIHELGLHLDYLNQLCAAEMARPSYLRQYKLLSFIYKERCVYEFALAELTNLLKQVEADTLV
ncbi:hypothetical protein [Fibrella aquatilis]|uniref:Uncharacterized protein n=1 Tax=Fibrella aquatilis TaxID=2817059 RepID=A0A939JY25_9BACT|nr:hypothetical protein [Fibrella aquatilis]MBO0933577.1 hypothetical protein [Fibrella aquatilis]